MPCQLCAKPTTSHPPVTIFAILRAASLDSAPVVSSNTFVRPGTNEPSTSARSMTGRDSIPEYRWSSRPMRSRTTSTISGCEWPRIALICPLVKSSTRRPDASSTNEPLARSAMNGTQVAPYRTRWRSARARASVSVIAIIIACRLRERSNSRVRRGRCHRRDGNGRARRTRHRRWPPIRSTGEPMRPQHRTRPARRRRL